MSNVFDSMISNSDREASDEPSELQNTTFENAPVGNVPGLPSERGALGSELKSTTPREVREITQELLREGYIEESRKPNSFRKVVVHQKAINAALEPLDLELQLDEHRGIGFLKVGELEKADSTEERGWSHPLVRRQRLTLEQSMLVAILRQAFVVHEQESGVGAIPARIAVEELLPQFLTYFEDSGSDAKNESRLLGVLDQLKTHGVVSEVDAKQEVTIRPMIAYLANPESLAALLAAMLQHAESASQSKGAAESRRNGGDHE